MVKSTLCHARGAARCLRCLAGKWACEWLARTETGRRLALLGVTSSFAASRPEGAWLVGTFVVVTVDALDETSSLGGWDSGTFAGVPVDASDAAAGGLPGCLLPMARLAQARNTQL